MRVGAPAMLKDPRSQALTPGVATSRESGRGYVHGNRCDCVFRDQSELPVQKRVALVHGHSAQHAQECGFRVRSQAKELEQLRYLDEARFIVSGSSCFHLPSIKQESEARL